MPTPKLARLTLDHLEARDVPAAFVVAPTGLDTNPGTAAQPFATLQAAANKVHAGDTVTVEPGTYAGFNLTTSGTATARIVFQADPTAAAGSVVVNRPNPWNHIDGINLEGASYATIDGFKVINQPRAGIRAVTDQFVTIKNNIADANTTWGIFTGFSDDLLIQNNQASNTKQQHGIYVSNSGDRPVVRGNYVFGNNDSGIQLNADLSSGGDGTISNALIENNLIVGNGAGGGGSINLDGVVNSVVRNNRIDQAKAAGITLFHQDGATGSYGNAIVNNTVIVDYVGSVSRGRDALAISGGSTGATVLNNILFTTNPNARALSVAADSQTGLVSDYNALPANSIAAGRDAHSIGLADGAALNALFVNRAGGDLHLKPGSAAVDAGTTTSAPASDFEGTPRPSGPRVDIGADEVYVAVAPAAAPTISPIGNLTIGYNSTGQVSFTVGDAATAAGALTVTATSSNATLLSAGGLALGGSGANRTLTLTPAKTASGTATITVVVTNAAGKSVTTAFSVTVSAAPPVPPAPPARTRPGFR